MAHRLNLADPGEGIHEVEVVEVRVSAGDTVSEGDVLLTVESDKATTEVPSPWSGTVTTVAVGAGEVVQVGALLVELDGAPKEADAPGSEDENEPESESQPEPDGESGDEDASEEAPEPEEAPEAEEEAESGDGPVPAAPATRRLARELGVDLAGVRPTGPEGRVTADDVRAAAGAAAPAGDDEERVPLRGPRRVIAERTARSWREIPHVTHMDVADVTELERLRRAGAPALEERGVRLTLTPLVLRAAVACLREFPRFNARLDAGRDEIVLRRRAHVAVAVDTDRGLLMPVLRDAGAKSVADIARELGDLAERARAGELERADLAGGTFGLTNPGSLGGTAFTPIVAEGTAAMLGLARARLEQVVTGDLDDDRVAVRLRLPICLAFDHRLNDGADAARFVSRLCALLADPGELVLNL